MIARHYQIALFERESPKDKNIYGVIRWSSDGCAPVLLGVWESRETALMAVRKEIEHDSDEPEAGAGENASAGIGE